MTGERFDDFIQFVIQLEKRLDAGAAAYGDKSFSKDPVELVRELKQEALDLAGWGFILFERLRALEAAAAGLKTESGTPLVVIRRPGRSPEPAPVNGKPNGAAHTDPKEPSS